MAQNKEVWDIQIKMAQRFLEVCEKHGLRAWAVSGTLLGAVRHRGFIPWDDDIDFMMFRDDYDRLQQVAAKEFQSPYHFQSPYTKDGYYRGHSQLRYDGTAMMLPHEPAIGCSFHQGVFIDIFVADGFPEDKWERNRLVFNRTIILNYLWARRYPLYVASSPRCAFLFMVALVCLGAKLFWSDLRLYRHVEDMHRAYPVKDYERHCCTQFGYLPRWVRRREWFDETVWLPFENIKLPAPAKYHEALTQEYGDYMTPVKDGSCHGEVIVDTHKSYTEYLPSMKISMLKAFCVFISKCFKNILILLGLRNKKNVGKVAKG